MTSFFVSEPIKPVIEYPDSDGESMADNTLQFEWIAELRAEHAELRAKNAELRAENAELKAEQERQRTEKLISYLRSQGINPDKM